MILNKMKAIGRGRHWNKRDMTHFSATKGLVDASGEKLSSVPDLYNDSQWLGVTLPGKGEA